MDPSDSHQLFEFTTSTYVPEGVNAQNIAPLATPTLNESNRVEAQVEPDVEPVVETQVEPQVQPQAPSEAGLVPAQPSSNRRPYTEMIYDAVVALNDPAGSSQGAITRYMKRMNLNLHDSDHDGLMAHHLEVMMKFGILTKVNNSYKLADSSPPVENVAVAGPVVASGSGIPPTNTGSLEMLAATASGWASQPQKRGRGRPPKAKTEATQQQQPIDAQPISQVLQPFINVEPSGEQPELPVTNPTQVVTESAKKRPGRPRKDGSGPSVSTANLAVTMKRRGWPTSCRASGRERKPISVPAPPAYVIPVLADGAGRPEIGGYGGVATLASAGVEEAMAVAALMKRGPGRPSKRGRRRGRGRTAGRPIQDTPRLVTRATGTTQGAGNGELKRKLDLALEKANEILNVLNAGIETRDHRAGAQAAQVMEELIQMMTLEPQAMEEVQSEEAAPLIEAETQGMELGQGSQGGGGGGGGEQAHIETLPQTLILTQPQPQTLAQRQPQLQSKTLPQTLTPIQPQTLARFEYQPQTIPMPPTLTFTQPEPDILPELLYLPDIEHLPYLGPLTLTQPQLQNLPPLQPITEAEEIDEDMFDF